MHPNEIVLVKLGSNIIPEPTRDYWNLAANANWHQLHVLDIQYRRQWKALIGE